MKNRRAMIIFELDIELRYVDNSNRFGIDDSQSLIMEPMNEDEESEKEEEEGRDDSRSLTANICSRINSSRIEDSIEEMNR